MTRNVTVWLLKPVRDTPTRDVGHPLSPDRMRQSPTRQGPRGKGLPAGWVTGLPGIPRTYALRILGNGVVPRQGARALHLLIAVTAYPAPPATASGTSRAIP